MGHCDSIVMSHQAFIGVHYKICRNLDESIGIKLLVSLVVNLFKVILLSFAHFQQHELFSEGPARKLGR